MDKSTISITLWGDALKKGNWLKWYDFVNSVIIELGYDKTHIAIESDVYTTPKIVTVRRKEKQILQMIENGAQPTCFSVYSLPEQYKIASFDYNILTVRTKKYSSFIFNKCDWEKIDVEDLVLQMKKYVVFERGEIYEMSKDEVPLIYAAQANPIDTYKTLQVLKKI